ncbi:MAG: glycosyltransferase family 4 protein [Acidobacteriaceae bacterium]|nr:glycosyltransferase family 4 protein [Acidobacteriaceae bacterium]
MGRTIHYHGFLPREEVLEILYSAPVAFFPSFSEAFALAPMEAMARACATIYTTLASGPELVEDGRTGLLVDPSHPERLTAAIIRLLQDPSLTESLATEGRRHIAANFSLASLAAKNEEFYRNCVAKFDSCSRGVDRGGEVLYASHLC